MVRSSVGDICRPGGKQGIFLPTGDTEREASDILRAPIYLLFLVWFFIGVAIIADVFVGSIEVITSVRKKFRLKSGRLVTTKVWNDTVANLSLMALGSSAPEIFLSFIELNSNSMYVGDLGPSTIVGSAAFNLLVIVAVCMVVIPDSETRRIKEINAFFVTAAFSLFAYVWLVFILVISTPEIVSIPEALITFGMLPAMIWISYLMDVGDLRAIWIVRLFKGNRLDDWDNEEAPDRSVRFCAGDTFPIARPSEKEQTVEISVTRLAFKEAVEFCYRTEPFSAVPGYDYESTEGTLEFAKGIDEVNIEVVVHPNQGAKAAREFLLILEDPGYVAGGERTVDFDPSEDGGQECAILTVAIGATDDDSSDPPQQRCRCCKMDWYRIAMSDWADQWRGCLYVNGSAEDQAEASKADWVWHIITVPWNILFSAVPPTSLLNGWACFSASLFMIALITAILLDVAELVGCVLEVPDVITAITFVALGTSMPDLFASISAAKSDPTADAAIVNVTGSNCVNVFLGLGAPWTIAAFYWSVHERIPGGEWETKFPEMAQRIQDKCVFVVESRNLGFSVLMFTAAFVVACLVIMVRRKLLGAELGGNKLKWICFGCFIFMWIGWVYIVSWRVLNYDVMTSTDEMQMVGGVGFIQLLVASSCLIAVVVHWRRSRRQEVVAVVDLVKKESLTDDEAANRPFQVFGGLSRGKSMSSASWRSSKSCLEEGSVPSYARRVSTRSAVISAGGCVDGTLSDLIVEEDCERVVQTPEEADTFSIVCVHEQNVGQCADELKLAAEAYMDQVSQPEPEPFATIDDLEPMDLPPEHASPQVASSYCSRLVSHGPSTADVAVSLTDTNFPFAICCTPRDNGPRTPRGGDVPVTPRVTPR